MRQQLKRLIHSAYLPSRRIYSLDQREQASLLLKLLWFGIFAIPLILLLHFFVAGSALPIISYSVDVTLAVAVWMVLYVLAHTRYYRFALYNTIAFAAGLIISSYFAGNRWSLFYFVPILALSAFLFSPFEMLALGIGSLIVITILPQMGDTPLFSALSIVLFVTWATALIIAQHMRSFRDAYYQELATYDRYFRMLLQDAYGLLILCEGKIESADHHFANLVNVPTRKLIGRDIQEFLGCDGDTSQENIEQGGGESIGTLLRRSDGRVLHVEVLRTSLFQDGRELLAVRDITASKEREAELRRQALYDDLTGLPNRRYLLQTLPLYYQPSHPLVRAALLFIDLDGFKQVNDTFGHAAGDTLLKMIAERLRKAVRAEDFVARYAGDEFVVIYNIPAGETVSLIERIRSRLHGPYVIEGQEFHLTVSIGVVRDISDFPSVEELIRHADAMMYRAKNAGKAQVVYASPVRDIRRSA